MRVSLVFLVRLRLILNLSFALPLKLNQFLLFSRLKRALLCLYHPLPPSRLSFVPPLIVTSLVFFRLQWFWVDSNGGSSSCGSDSEKRGWKRRRKTRRRKNDRTRRPTTSRKPTPITTTTSNTITQRHPTLITKPRALSHLKSLLLRLNLATTARPTRKDALMEMCSHR